MTSLPKNEYFGKRALVPTRVKVQSSAEQGVTLLLAILILGSLLAISFSISTILFVEIRTSGDLLRTEQAIYGAQAITEEAIFQVKRQVPNPTYTTRIGGVDLASPPPEQSTTSTPVQEDLVPTTSASFETSTNHYLIFDSANPNNTSSNYGHIKVTYLTGQDTLGIYLCQYNAATPVDAAGSDSSVYVTSACSDKTDRGPSRGKSYWLARDNTISANPPGGIKEWDLDPSQLQELILYNYSRTSGPIYVQIQSFAAGTPGPCNSGDYAYGGYCYTPKGLPYFSEVSVSVTAVNNGVTRKIRSIIPKIGQ